MALARGTHLGPYEILDLVGVGGMGHVYRAHDPRLHRDVAVKVLPADVATDADRLARFASEARAAAALNHPNILAVHDVSDVGSTPYIVTELLDGATLAETLARAGRALPVRRAADIARQVAEGLSAAHAHGIVHRDIKPANIFVLPELQPILTEPRVPAPVLVVTPRSWSERGWEPSVVGVQSEPDGSA